MKNLFLSWAMACAALLTGINQTQAQDLKPRYGITAGADYTTLGKSSYALESQSFNFKWRYGFQAGVYADLPLSTKFSITPQVLYTQKGGQVNMGIPEYSVPDGAVNYNRRYEGSTKLNYIDIPVLVTYKACGKLSIFAGPQVSFLLSQRSSFTDTRNPDPIYWNSNSKGGFTKTIIGGNAGIGYNYDKHLGLNLHYAYDFQHIGTNTDVSNSTERNSGFALMVSYLF